MIINSAKLAYWVIEHFKSDWDYGNPNLDMATLGTSDFELQYTMNVIRAKVVRGIGVDVYNKKVLEIGCGRGGVSFFMAMNGAKEVVGVDLSDEALFSANRIKEQLISSRHIDEKIVRFQKELAENTSFPDNYFDLIVADNVLEHLNQLDDALKECKRILKPGGQLYAPNFPAFYSKNGPHLKFGTKKIPWLHIIFTEKALCEAIYIRAIKHPDLNLFEWYGGLKYQPKTFRDMRRYKDLGYITHKKLRLSVKKNSMILKMLKPRRVLMGKIIMKICPILQRTILDDILSNGTTALIQKRSE